MRGQPTSEFEATGCLRPGAGCLVKGCSAQNEASNPLRVDGRQLHRDAAAVRVPEDDHSCLHLVEHRCDRVRVVHRTPHLARGGRTPKAGQVEGHRVDAPCGEHGVEVAVVTSPAVKSEDPRRSGAVTLAEQTRPGEGREHPRKLTRQVATERTRHGSSLRPTEFGCHASALRQLAATVCSWSRRRRGQAISPGGCWPDATLNSERRSPPKHSRCVSWLRLGQERPASSRDESPGA